MENSKKDGKTWQSWLKTGTLTLRTQGKWDSKMTELPLEHINSNS